MVWGMESETHSDEFPRLLELHPGMTAVLPRLDPAIGLTWWQFRLDLVWLDTTRDRLPGLFWRVQLGSLKHQKRVKLR